MYNNPTHAASMRIYHKSVRKDLIKVIDFNRGKMSYASGHLEYLFKVYNLYIAAENSPEKITCPACINKVTNTLKRYVEQWKLYGIGELNTHIHE